MDTIIRLTKALTKLYPSGKAFKLFSTAWKSLNVALLEEPVDIRAFMVKVRDSGIPGRLPSEALEDWEELFQLQENAVLTDVERNARIKARYDAVGGQGLDYLQDVLRDQFQFLVTYFVFGARCNDGQTTCGNPVATCGTFFDADGPDILTLYENDPVRDPSTINGFLIKENIGDSRSLLPTDSDYWKPIWIISGPDGLGSFFQLPAEREAEFVEAVLRIKPVRTWVLVQVTLV